MNKEEPTEKDLQEIEKWLNDDSPATRDNEELSMTIYLKKIRKITLITKQEELELFQSLEKSTSEEDKQAIREKIITANLRLVLSVAKRFRSKTTPSMDFSDLIQEGNIGLMHAIKKFDWRKGYKLSTFASPCISDCIARAIKEQSQTIRMPLSATKIAAPILLDSLDAVLNYSSDDEGYEATTLLDLLSDESIASPENEAIICNQKEIIANMLSRLPTLQQVVIDRRFGITSQQKETELSISQDLHLSRVRVQQIQEEALNNLRHPGKMSQLREL